MFRRTVTTFKRRGCGIVGLPNVGKSTLFNAMTASQLAQTGNYPFCTINANLAKVNVHDTRVRDLAKLSGAKQLFDVEVDLADVAGLIEGAHKGEGMGNKFLADIRPCTTILHMVRCFESPQHGFDAPAPLEDISTIHSELVFADIEAVEKRLLKLKKSGKASDEESTAINKVHKWLSDGNSARDMTLTSKEAPRLQPFIDSCDLLSAKPIMYVLNVDDGSIVTGNSFSKLMEDKYGVENTVKVCSLIEEQTAQFTREERLAFLEEYGVSEPSVEILLRKVFAQLNLQSFFTVGPKMVKAWAIKQGTTSIDAAGEIHTDFKKHFYQARVSPWQDFASKNSFDQAEKAMKVVDDEYVMQDGDVFVVEHRAEKK